MAHLEYTQQQNRPLRYNTTVIHGNDIGVITRDRSSKSENITIKLLSNGHLLNVKKRDLKTVPHDIGDLIKYKDKDKTVYYIISGVSLNSSKTPIYKISYVNKTNKKIENNLLSSTDKYIITIDNKMQQPTIRWLKFMDRYNRDVSFLNQRTVSDKNYFAYLSSKNVEEDMHNLRERCHVEINQLDKMLTCMKKTHNRKLQIKNLYRNPYFFITEEYQLITFNQAEKIEKEYLLDVDFIVKIEKWSYDLFLRDKKAFYIPTEMYEKELSKFCAERGQNSITFVRQIDRLLLTKTINKESYKTTKYFLQKERELTDLVLELFHDKTYDSIPNEKILHYIHEYERYQSKILSKPFLLEKEQHDSVKASIKNRLSIINGPPGTGKTEILKCINFVIQKLYETSETEESDEINDNTYVNSKHISLIAPTGLALVNMLRTQRATHYNSSISGTCHRVLYHTIPNIKNDVNETDKHIHMFEIDETSMLDVFMFSDILTECKYFNSRLILIGDTNQLPSIGPGKILYQLVNSKHFTVTTLSKIKRQNAGALVNNIIKMKDGAIGICDFVDDTMTFTSIYKILTNNILASDKIKSFIETNGLTKDDTKFITGFGNAKFITNSTCVNVILQEIFNPPNDDIYDNIPSNHKYENKFTFRVGDEIIRTENDYSGELFRANGEEATILQFDGKLVKIEYKTSSGKQVDNIIDIGVDELYENFQLNYCITVHKSQGSQYVNVVFLIEPKTSFIDKKSIYTAVSRAREKCFIFANQTDFISLQNNICKGILKKTLFMVESNKYG